MIVLWLILAVVVVMAAVVLVRTARFTPGTAPLCPRAKSIDRDKAVENLRTLIRCRTVSNTNHALEDDVEFESSSIPCRRSTPTFSRPASLSALRTVACCSPGPARSTPSRPY